MSLSEKTNLGIVTHTNQRQYEWVKLDDVREAVKELRENWLMLEYSDLPEENTEMRVNEIIKKIFGEKLV